MKKMSIFLIFIIFLSCEKKTQKVYIPKFAFLYADDKIWYSLDYAENDTLYLTDRINNKNYFTIINEEKKMELSNIVNPITSLEDISYSGNGENLKFDCTFWFLEKKTKPKKVYFHKNADKEIYEAALKVIALKSKLKFLKADKEFSFEADSIRQATAGNSRHD